MCIYVQAQEPTGRTFTQMLKGLCLVMGSWLIFFPPPIVNVIFNRKKKKERKVRGIPWWPNG